MGRGPASLRGRKTERPRRSRSGRRASPARRPDGAAPHLKLSAGWMTCGGTVGRWDGALRGRWVKGQAPLRVPTRVRGWQAIRVKRDALVEGRCFYAYREKA